MEDTNAPDISILAQAAEASYSPDAEIPKYKRLKHYSSPDVATFEHESGSNFIIAHRGTDLADKKTLSADLKQDLKILIGDKSNTKFLKNRTDKTAEIIGNIKLVNPEARVHLTGHSLGGHSAQHAMVINKDIRDNVTSLDTFNAGASPFKMRKPLSKTGGVYKVLAAKSTHHRIKGDEISAGIDKHVIGEIKEYEPTVKPSIGKRILNFVKPLVQKLPGMARLAHFAADKVLGTLQSHSLQNFI